MPFPSFPFGFPRQYARPGVKGIVEGDRAPGIEDALRRAEGPPSRPMLAGMAARKIFILRRKRAALKRGRP